MDRHAVHPIGAKNFMSISGAFPPGRVISESRDHLDIVTIAPQKFAERDVVWRDPGYFGRVVDAPNDYAHRLK